jgi:hypothetical protein
MKITFNTPIRPVLGVRDVRGGRVGIELEYEECNVTTIALPKIKEYWSIDIDHSLRNGGIEFISAPLGSNSLPKALALVQEELRQAGGVANKRCGVHVHLNVADLTFAEVWKITTYYALIEAFIFKEFAEGREENHFCVPLFANTVSQQDFHEDANALRRGVYKGAKKLTPGAVQFLDPPEDPVKGSIPLNILSAPKYAAMNTGSLSKFGTLEFRQMRGTLDLDKVWRWAEFILRLRDAALSYESAEHILQEYENNGFDHLCGDLNLPQHDSAAKEDLEDCIDGAFMMSGHEPTKHTELDWEL